MTNWLSTALRGPNARLRIGLAVWALTEVYFLACFRQAYFQPTVDLAWSVSVLAWLVAFWRSEQPSAPPVQHPYWFYALYVAILLPFGTNWRWVMAGDNLTWPHYGIAAAEHGFPKSLLSADGADNFGHLQTTLHNIFMLLVQPTLFWHRVGKVTVGLCALAAVYTVFARMVGPRFGLLVAAASSACSVWIVYTYASVPFMDGIASGYALLAIGLWVRRDPLSRKAWLALGGLSGFMLFLTPNGWMMAICVWVWLTVQMLWRSWPVTNWLLAGATGLVVGLPMLVQWAYGTEGDLFTLVRNPAWTMEKVERFVREAALFPVYSGVNDSGAFGPQLPWGFRWLFVPGILLTPLFGKRFPWARFVLSLFLVHVVALAFAQGPYGSVSVKRALILIPMATYFVFLPFHQYLRSLPVVLSVLAVWVSLGVYDIMARIQPGRTGYTLMDGIVEAHQRFNDAPVCVYLRSRERAGSCAPGELVDRLYHLAPRLQLVSELTDPACREVLCFSPPDIDPPPDFTALGYVEVPMMSTKELRCGRRTAPAS